MELLVLLLGELLFAPFLAALGILVQLLVTGLELVLELVFGLVGVLQRGKAPEKTPAVRRRSPVWVRRLRWTLLGAAAASLVLAFVAGTFFVPTLVGWIAGRIEDRTGIALSYTSVGGNLFFGDLEFEGLELRRKEDELSAFDLTVESCTLDMNLWSALSSPVVLHTVGLRGVRGTYERHRKRDRTQPRRAFEVGDLTIEDLEIRVIDHAVKHGVLDVPVVVKRGRSRPMRSEYALFDALFRSDLEGEIAGRHVAVESEETPGGRVTRWRGTELPLELASHWVGGPFRWIASGRLDVHVDDTWRREDTIMIDCHWRLSLRDIVAEVPDDTRLGLVRGGAAKVAVAWLNRRDKPLEFEFDLTIDEQSFKGASSLLHTDFVDKVAEAAKKMLSKLIGK